jgi:hypothetical protein
MVRVLISALSVLLVLTVAHGQDKEKKPTKVRIVKVDEKKGELTVKVTIDDKVETRIFKSENVTVIDEKGEKNAGSKALRLLKGTNTKGGPIVIPRGIKKDSIELLIKSRD